MNTHERMNAQPEPKIEVQLKRLTETVERLRDDADMLATRIEPILSPGPSPSDMLSEKTPHDAESPLASILRELDARLGVVQLILGDALDRCELDLPPERPDL